MVAEVIPNPDVLVVGSGPAALSLAAACTARGLSVAGVAPQPHARWAPRYGAWADELPPLPAEAIEHTWPIATVHTPQLRRLHRPYVRLSTSGLQAWLMSRCSEVDWTSGVAASVTHDAVGSTLTLRSGQILRAAVVVDATGAGVLLEQRPSPDAWQVAFGQQITVAGGHPWPLDAIELMDFRGAESPPSFLYAQPLSEGTVFVEETSLICAPGLSPDVLRARLQGRLRALGVIASTAEHDEVCRIQMLGPTPVIGQRVLAYGASAGMVQPASGYLVARVLTEAAGVAEAVEDGLRLGPAAASASAWATLWPATRQRQWALYRFGARILRDLDADGSRNFFDGFFQIDPSLWKGFLSATLSPAQSARAMAAVFAASPSSTRRRLLSAGASSPGLRLLHSLAGASL